jgi:hypothetical protein
MPEEVNPDDVPLEQESVTVNDVLSSVEALQLTVDSLLQLLKNIARIALLFACAVMLGMLMAMVFP